MASCGLCDFKRDHRYITCPKLFVHKILCSSEHFTGLLFHSLVNISPHKRYDVPGKEVKKNLNPRIHDALKT